MEDKIEEIFSGAFQKNSSIEELGDEAVFTANLMKKLPHQNISYKKRNTVLCLCTFVATAIPFLDKAYEEVYIFGELEIMDGFLTLQYWVEQLVMIT